jgi:hypothetical protein
MSAGDELPEPGLAAEQREVIAKRLAERDAQGPCPACHSNAWILGHAHSLLTVSVDKQGGEAWPVVSRICTNCGYLSLHATAVLGI